jgi:hypothetical protein
VDVLVADEFCVWATILRTCLALRWGAQIADVPFALRCVGAPNLRTCLALRWGAHLADVRTLRCIGVPNLRIKKSTCQNLFLSILQLVPCSLVWTFSLRWGAHLADVPCVALWRPNCGRALRLRCGRALRLRYGRAPDLGEAVLKSLPPSQNLFLSILQLVF